MRNCLRKAGIDIVGDVPWGTHICQFFQTKEDLTDILVPYFKQGLENNEFCLWITSQPLDVEAAIEVLRKDVPDLNVYLEKGQIEIISHNDWFLTEGEFDPEKVSNGCAEKLSYASQNGYEGVRLSGNNSWLDKESWDSFIKFKEQMDNVIGNCHMIALCTYFLDKHNVDEIIYLGVNHQFTLVKSVGRWKLIESYKRKMAEEAAVKATKDWEHTFDAVPDLIVIIDTNYRVVRANRAMASKLGVTPEECIGLTCYRVVHGMTRPPSFCPHMQLLKDGFEHTAEVCEDCLGGFFIVSVSPLYDSDGKLTGSIHVARDINERRQMEEALRASEEKYRNLIETANEGIWILDTESITTYVNVKLAEMIGYNREDIVGKSIRDFTDEEGKEITRLNMEKRRHGANESHEFKLIRKDGLPLWAHLNSKSFFDNSGAFVGSMHMLTDISERKDAEAKLKETLDNLENLVKERTAELERAYNSLKESEKGLAEAQRMANVGNMDWNLATGEVYWSDELYRIFRRNPQEPGLTYDEFLSYVHSDDRDRIYNAAKKALYGKPMEGDYTIILANGEERKVHTHIEVIFDEKKNPIRMKGTFQDITEIKQTEKSLQESEARFRNLFEVLSSGVAIYDVIDDGNDFIFKDINSAGELIEHAQRQDIIGKSFHEFFPNVDETGIDATFKRVWLTGIPECFPMITYKNEKIALWVTNYIYRLTSGELVAVFDDITARKKAEETLSIIEISRKQEIHHRIKNNLQVISSLLELQAEKFRNRECIRDSEVMEAFRESQDRVISMALIHEELYRGDGLETLNFSQYIEELAGNLFLTYRLGNTNVSLNMDLAENLFFDMDTAIPLGTIVNELVSNSLKYAFTGRDKGEIRIELRREESKNEESQNTSYTLTVSDNGVGIPDSLDIENLDSLGMQLVVSLVDQLDGEFELKRNNGTEFTVRFTVTEKNTQASVPAPLQLIK